MTTIELAAALEDAALELWIDSEELDGERILTPEALSVLAGAIGRDERLWRQHARHEHDVRFTQLLHRQANLDVWLLCWIGAQETGLHDHEVSAGAFYVCEGRLVEDILLADASGSVRTEVRVARAGAAVGFDGSRIHGVRHEGPSIATSIHVYSPALEAMGHYESDGGGVLRRVRRTYGDEAPAR